MGFLFLLIPWLLQKAIYLFQEKVQLQSSNNNYITINIIIMTIIMSPKIIQQTPLPPLQSMSHLFCFLQKFSIYLMFSKCLFETENFHMYVRYIHSFIHALKLHSFHFMCQNKQHCGFQCIQQQLQKTCTKLKHFLKFSVTTVCFNIYIYLLK